MVCSKHFTYSTETEIDLGWKWVLRSVECWEKEHGMKLYHNTTQDVWYDVEGNNGFKVVRPEGRLAFKMGANQAKAAGVKTKGKAWQHTGKEDRVILEVARLAAGVSGAGIGNVGADIFKGKDGKWYPVEK